MQSLIKLAVFFTTTAFVAHAAEPCRTIHGRAIMYNGDGQLRIWEIGTHHTFSPVGDPSWELLGHYMQESRSNEMMTKILFANFEICPTEPIIKGATQLATVKKVVHPVVLTWEDWHARFHAKE